MLSFQWFSVDPSNYFCLFSSFSRTPSSAEITEYYFELPIIRVSWSYSFLTKISNSSDLEESATFYGKGKYTELGTDTGKTTGFVN